jgi:hypothetical protein
VLSKCANPTCLARFHYLHEGRIFKLETGTVSSDRNGSPPRRIEHFWLCERCAQTLTVVLENGAVTTRPLHLGLAEGVAQENSERKRHIA